MQRFSPAARCSDRLLLLGLLGLRRRLPVLPLGSVSTWTQIHIYTGIFSAGVYLMHVPSIVAGGVFECALSITFLLVTISGIYGIYASRTLPKRLTAVEGQHRFDRVRWHRAQIADAARNLLDELNEQTGMRVLGVFYTKYLSPFFNDRPSLAYVMVPTGTRRRRLLSGLQELDRYLESDSRGTAGRFAALVAPPRRFGLPVCATASLANLAGCTRGIFGRANRRIGRARGDGLAFRCLMLVDWIRRNLPNCIDID